VTSYGGRLVDDTVSGVMQGPGHRFGLLLDSGRAVSARRLLLTTGLRDEVPDLAGVRERWGSDLLHCPYCHGHEVRDQPLGVLGGTPGALQHAQIVRQWSHDVVFFAHTTEPTDAEREQLSARAIGLVEGLVDGLVVEDDRLTGVRLRDGRVVPRTAVFVRPELVGRNDFVRGLGGATDDTGWPVADASGRTSVPGLWVAGNAVDPRAQVITAAGQGSAAAIAINNDLVEDDVRDAVTAFRAGLP
jgi:thioredoxin reductase